jgi:hypothetical protein
MPVRFTPRPPPFDAASPGARPRFQHLLSYSARYIMSNAGRPASAGGHRGCV